MHISDRSRTCKFNFHAVSFRMHDSQSPYRRPTLTRDPDPIAMAERASHLRGRGWGMVRVLGIWAVVAVMAAGAMILAVRTETGSKRLASLLNPPPPANAEPAGGSPSPNPMDASAAADALRADIHGLSERLRRLTEDTERLSQRLATVERSLDRTGSVPKSPAAEADAPRPGPASDVSAGTPRDAMVAVEGYGIDLGPAGSLEELRENWAVIRAQHGGLLEELRPVAAIEKASNIDAAGMRLVVGPLPNLYAAARLCAVINRTGPACHPTRLEGERIALR